MESSATSKPVSAPSVTAGEIERVEKQIAEIGEYLKGPGLSQIERILAYNDRKDLRQYLTRLKEAQS